MLDVAAPRAEKARPHRERLDDQERRYVGAAAMPNGQIGALGVERRKEVQGQSAKLDLGVEPVGQCFSDSLAKDVRREWNPDGDRDRENREDRRNRRTDEPAASSW